MNVTLKQIAKQAGVAISTVSVILNGKAGNYNISKETETRVRGIAEELSYRVSGSALALLKGRNDCVGLLSPSISDLLHTEIYNQIFTLLNQYCYEKDLNMMTLTLDESDVDIPSMIRLRNIDGVFLVHQINPEIWCEIEKLKLPAVSINVQSPNGFDSVLPDDFQGMNLAVDHLVKLGHQRILYLNRYLNRKDAVISHPSVVSRLNGFKHAVVKHGLELYKGWDTPVVQAREDCISDDVVLLDAFLPKLLALPVQNRPTAIILYSGMWLRNVVIALKKANLQVPQDISIVCCDQSELVRQWIPAITHIEIPTIEMAKTAAEMLYKKVNRQNVMSENVLLPERLIEMESTAPVIKST